MNSNNSKKVRYSTKEWNGVRPVQLDVTFEVDPVGIAIHNAVVLDQTGRNPTPFKSYCPRCRMLFPIPLPKHPPQHPVCLCCSRPLIEPWYMTAFENFLDTSLDATLSHCGALTWLPWTGRRFSEIGNELGHRIMIFGESHYTNQKNPSLRQLDIAEWIADDWSTREVVAWYPLLGPALAGASNNGGGCNVPTYDNLFEIIAGDSFIDDTPRNRIQRAKLCSAICFANFFQRPFTYISTWRERPSCTYANDDHLPAWETALHEIAVLKPALCLFLGVTAAKCFDYYMKQFRTKFNITAWNLVEQQSRINGCKPRSATITIGGSTVQLEFIKHPGMFITCSSWRTYLRSRVPWFKNQMDSILS